MTQLDDLATAIEAGDAAKVEPLLVKHPELVNGPEWTPPPLHCAVLWNQPRVAEILLEHGADIEIRDPEPHTRKSSPQPVLKSAVKSTNSNEDNVHDNRSCLIFLPRPTVEDNLFPDMAIAINNRTPPGGTGLTVGALQVNANTTTLQGC